MLFFDFAQFKVCTTYAENEHWPADHYAGWASLTEMPGTRSVSDFRLFLEFGYLQIPNEGGMGPKSKHEIHVSYIPTHTAWR